MGKNMSCSGIRGVQVRGLRAWLGLNREDANGVRRLGVEVEDRR